VAAGQWQGASSELTGGTGRAPGKVVGGGAHLRGGGGCFGRQRSSMGRDLQWPAAMEA
jgi:hypothetical protein